MPATLAGAAISSPDAVCDPGRFGSQCCVKYTRISSEMTVEMVLLLTDCVLWAQSVSSLTAVRQTLRVSAFTLIS